MAEEESIELLKNIGLSEAGAEIYMLLLKRGAMKASEIARLAKLNRSSLYRILDRMIRKKLIYCSVKDKIKMFYVGRPKRLKELYRKNLI